MFVSLLCLPLFLAPCTLSESRLSREHIDCPVCRKPFEAVLCVDANTQGGVDRDLFARSLGPQPEYYRVFTCPRCGYSGYGSDFDPAISLSAEVKRKIQTEPKLTLPAGFGPDSDPRRLDALDRYRLAITCYEWRQKSDEALAWLHLRTSWIIRDEGASLPSDPRLVRMLAFAERWRPTAVKSGNQWDIDMQTATRLTEAVIEGRFNRFQRPYAELAACMILRNHGENRQAGPMLDRLMSEADWSPVLAEAMRRMQTSIPAEQQHQRQAAARFEKAIRAQQIAAANRATALYLLGELHRRLGDDAKARDWYDQASASTDLPATLRAWLDEQRRWCSAENPLLNHR